MHYYSAWRLYHNCNSLLTARSLSLSLALSKIMMLNQDLTVPILHSKPDVFWNEPCCAWMCIWALHVLFFVSVHYLLIFQPQQGEAPGELHKHTHADVWICSALSHHWLQRASQIPNSVSSSIVLTSARSLHLCASAMPSKPLEDALPAINVRNLSHKINEPRVTGQMTLSKIGSSICLPSLDYALLLQDVVRNFSIRVNIVKIYLFLSVCISSL